MRLRLDAYFLCIAAILLIIPLVLSSFTTDMSQEDFMNGTFNGTRFNQSGWLELDGSAGYHNTNGTFVSRLFNASLIAEWKNISWQGDLEQGNITFQAAASDNASNCSIFQGPDRTEGTWYVQPGSLNLSHARYFRYRINLTTQNTSSTPKVHNVTIGHSVLLPEVTLFAPLNNSSANHSLIVFIYNVSSENPVTNCSLYINRTFMAWNDSPVVMGTQNNISLSLGNGNHTWTVGCMDPLGNQANATEYNLTVDAPDLAYPAILNVTNVSTTATTTSITWQTDEITNHSAIMGPNISLTFNRNSSASYATSHTITFQGLTNLTTYYYNITCCDPSGNCNTTGPFNVTTSYAPDTTDPSITLRSPASGGYASGNNLTFNCSASDYNLDNVSLYGNWSGTWALNQSNTSGVNTDYLFFLTLENGSYQWACHACDAEGNCVFSSNRTLRVGWAALEVVSTTPSNGTANASATMPISVGFNSPIDEAEIASSVRLLGPSGPFSFTASFDNTTNTATLTPAARLAYGTGYVINITTSLVGIYGETLSSDVKVWFETSPQDTDGDGNPDNNESDDDNDGLNDSADFLNGNATSIYSDASISVDINGSSNLSHAWTGRGEVRINASGVTLVEFPFFFSNSSILDLANISIQRDDGTGKGSIVIRGINLPASYTKTVWINDTDGVESDVCVKDSDIVSISELSPDCDAEDEKVVRCDGTDQDGYSCEAGSGGVRVTGLSHSGVIEECREDWECSSWIPLFCFFGRGQVRTCSDVQGCNTTRFRPTIEQLCENPISSASRGCRAQWECADWEGCVDGVEKRACVNVGRCPDHIQAPALNRSCNVTFVNETPGKGGESATGGDEGKVSDGAGVETPEIEQPVKPIFDEEGSPSPSVSEETVTAWPYILFAFLGIMIIAVFFYRSYHKPAEINKPAEIVPVRKERYLDNALKERKALISFVPHERTPGFSWPILWRNLRRHKDIVKLRRLKKLRQREFKEIRMIADTVKKSGDDSFVSRFMRYEMEDPSKLKAPDKPSVVASGVADRTLLWMHGIKHTKAQRAPPHLARRGKEQRMEELRETREETETGLMEKLDLIKKKLGEGSIKKEQKDNTKTGLEEKVESLKKSTDQETDGLDKVTLKREAVQLGTLMSKLRALNLPKRLGQSAHEVEKAADSFIEQSYERRKTLREMMHFSVRKHRKDLADLERTGLLARFVNDHEGDWNHADWEGLLLRARNLGYDIKDYELGAVLEMEKRRYKVRKELGR